MQSNPNKKFTIVTAPWKGRSQSRFQAVSFNEFLKIMLFSDKALNEKYISEVNKTTMKILGIKQEK